MKIQGVGHFKKSDGYWESEPEVMEGLTLSIESDEIEKEHELRALDICNKWEEYLDTCIDLIEENRKRYNLLANQFFNPIFLVNSGQEWTVYFSTEHEFESTVGVEFKANEPFQLIIGD